jgi:hypothetical protein
MKLLELFKASMDKGFIPIIVAENGPSPKIAWSPIRNFSLEVIAPPPFPTGVTPVIHNVTPSPQISSSTSTTASTPPISVRLLLLITAL